MRKQRNIFYLLFAIFFVTAFILLSHQPAFSRVLEDILRQQDEGELHIVVGDIDTIWTKELTRVAVANPSVADVVETKTTEILVVGKNPGKTDIYLWDKYGKRKMTVWVFEENLDLVQSRISELLKSASIETVVLEKNKLEGKLVASGEIEENEKDDYKAILEPFKGSVIDLVKEREKKELIEIDVQIAEVSSTYTENIGIEWTNSDGDGSYSFDEVLPAGNVKQFTDIFRIGKMSRVDAIQAKINALITEGKGKVLSKPKIVAKSGEDASFLVGGQIPVKTTTTSSGGNVEENVQFKDYGVQLNIKATAREYDKIDIELKVDISDIDAANAVGDIVAYTTRSAETKLFLDNGQTIILAGFMKDNKGETIKKLPLAGSIPIFGFLFRNKNISPNSQTELFITLTPRVIVRNEKKQNKDQEAKDLQAQKEKRGQAVIDSLAKTEVESPEAPTYQPVMVSGEMAFYAKEVQERIAKNVTYPKAARESKQQGTVELALSILRSGALVSASVNKSSGYTILDEAAMETVHRLSPYRAFPSETTLKKVTVTIPIVFQLN